MEHVKGLRIVGADDDVINVEIMVKNLKDGGHTATIFEEGRVTWEHLQAHPDDVDIVLLDKMMVTMTGMEINNEMKKHPILKDVPVIIQSGDAVPERIQEALDQGVDKYVVKPFTTEDLLLAIDEVAQDYGLNQ
tara:strand:- start:155 stop:556 length:402 start_codon:yes stop_codon:yes gene_type:complete